VSLEFCGFCGFYELTLINIIYSDEALQCYKLWDRGEIDFFCIVKEFLTRLSLEDAI